MRLKLGAVYGQHLNLNGDQGNLLSLRRYLEAAGHEVEIVDVTKASEATSVNFLLLGHGSLAAMRSLQRKFGEIDWQTVIYSVPTLAVASGASWLKAHLGGSDEIAAVEYFYKTSDRVSEFVTAKYEGLDTFDVLGYRNTPDDSEPHIEGAGGSLVLTMLHGPLLAKNPKLLNEIAIQIVGAGELVVPGFEGRFETWRTSINQIAKRIWQLESPAVEFPSV